MAGAISTADARGAAVAKDCKRNPCKQAIARCVREACAQFHGIVKRGCAKAARSTLLTSCTAFGDYGQFCSDLGQGNGCAPD